MDAEAGSESIGIIAGSRSLPRLFAGEARKAGVRRIIAVGFEGETDPSLAGEVDEIVWVKVGQLGRLIKAFATRGITKCVMLGQVAPKNLFHVQPDIRGAALLFRLKERNAHTIFGAIADELARDGVTLVSAAPWMKNFMPGAGFVRGLPPGEERMEDVNFGLSIAKAVSRLEIGQTVVVKQGTVLAVEGFEGTDACLIRGGQLAGKSGGATAVKVAKENHDMRFDIPCIGYTTLENCHKSGVAALAFEAGRTLLLDQHQWEPLLRKWKMTLLSVSGGPAQ
jgi:hypothetical protein